ncbi:MAG: CDP-diacylglycerol--glycerol-3-phosphate 3-phosphatidyltransferase [Aristaeellaceae bacterium]
MNTPNKLSILRVLLIPVMVILMYIPGVPCILLSTAVFGAAAFTDYLDGHIARRDNIVTDFGKFIDPVADKLLNLSAMIMLTLSGQMPHFVVIIILARELAVDGLRMVAVGQGRVIAAGKLGKIKTASQMAVIVYLMLLGRLVPAVEALAFLQLPVQIIGWLGCAWIAAMTIWSGVDYFIRNFDCIRNAK